MVLQHLITKTPNWWLDVLRHVTSLRNRCFKLRVNSGKALQTRELYRSTGFAAEQHCLSSRRMHRSNVRSDSVSFRISASLAQTRSRNAVCSSREISSSSSSTVLVFCPTLRSHGAGVLLSSRCSHSLAVAPRRVPLTALIVRPASVVR